LKPKFRIYIDEERQIEVDPVHIDDNGQPYLFFWAPGKQKQKFYLEKQDTNYMDKLRHSINRKRHFGKNGTTNKS